VRFFVGTRWWRALTVVSALVLYAISVSEGAYEFTTPTTMPHHVLVRKVLAVGAFALLGWLLEKSRWRRVRGVVAAGIVVGLYSFAIELGQIVVDRSAETVAEHAFDVASGLVGGALGAFVVLALGAPSRARRAEAVALAGLVLALAWAFVQTYARID